VWSDGSGAFWNSSVGNILFNDWGFTQPDNFLTGEDCSEVNIGQGAWNDEPCGDAKPYVCSVGSAPLTSIVCNNQPTVISCPADNQRLNIFSARYGRSRDAVACPYNFNGARSVVSEFLRGVSPVSRPFVEFGVAGQ